MCVGVHTGGEHVDDQSDIVAQTIDIRLRHDAGAIALLHTHEL